MRVVQEVLATREFRHARPFSVEVSGETLFIPYRVSCAVPTADAVAALTATQHLVLSCVLTRHDDGFVRQKYLEQAIGSPEPWVAPYVVQLVGEYVLQIVLAVGRGLTDVGVDGTLQQRVYGRFVADNPSFYRLIRQRVASYWDCYHRFRYPRLADYPGQVVVNALGSTASQGVGGYSAVDR